MRAFPRASNLRRTRDLQLCLLLVCVVLLAASAAAQTTVPASIPFQGRLTLQSNGSNAHGSYAMTFRLYRAATGGTPLWMESQPLVAVQNGLFKVDLGSSTPLDSSLFDGKSLWLGMQVGSDFELVPRLQLNSQAYAKLAEQAMDVAGRDIRPRSVTIGVKTVIDGTGKWVGDPTEVRGVPYGTQYPQALRDVLVRNGTLNADYTPNEATAARHGWKLKDPSEVPAAERWWLPADVRQRQMADEDQHLRPSTEEVR